MKIREVCLPLDFRVKVMFKYLDQNTVLSLNGSLRSLALKCCFTF